MKSLTINLIFLCSGFTATYSQVNLPCIDTTRVNPFYVCDLPDFLPVCGCDGVTYRNYCSAYYQGGVNYYTNGSCANYDFDILQNPVAFDVTLSIYTRKNQLVLVQIFNTFGKIIYSYNFTGYPESIQQFFIPTDTWQRGLYLVVVIVNGQQQVKKLMKANAS